MSRSFLLRTVGLCVLLVLCTSIFWFQAVASFFTHTGRGTTSPAHAAAAPRLTFHQYADGPYKVQGNQIIGADGQPYIFHGVGRDGYEFSCTGGGWQDSTHLAFMGPGTTSSSGTYWFSNTVRLPLSQGIWLNGIANQCTAAQYQAYVKATVDALTALNLNVMLDLQWSDADGQGPGAGWAMPDARSVTFWQQVAPIYAGYSNVLFEIYNEPHPDSVSSISNPWQCWQSGCQVTNDKSLPNAPAESYTAYGIQSLVNAVRNAHANNLVLIAGLNWGFDLSKIASYPITGSNIAYDSHPYPYGGKNTSTEWDAAFGFLTATAPVISAEFGEYDCANTFVSSAISYFDAHSMGWTAWAWFDVGGNNQGCGYPQLISDYQGTPLASMGTYIYQHLLSYVGQTNPPPPVGPVNTTWYFAEGRVGANFREFLSLENPTTNACAVNITYLAQPDGPVNPYTKNVAVTVPANTRVEEMVNTDLGLPNNGSGPGISDSAIVTVNTGSTPGCTGIVAERPMYFNFNYNSTVTNSGSDVIGITKLGTTFYFGDMGVGAQLGGHYSSFIAILNPPGGSSASVTASYYANGQKVGQQQVNVAGGTRGTINPAQASPALPARVAVVVTSSQPVAVERPTYFQNIAAGSAGTVSGAADVIGVQSLANDWLFAEGYTGGSFQENLVIANLDPANATASVSVILEPSNSSTKTIQFNVPANSQYVLNVNGQIPGQSISAEVKSSGAKIVAEREMYFQYNHAANGRVLNAIGATDVIGQLGPSAMSNYSFAEGYVNLGYDEWLTIQNPTTSQETITISLVNAKGTVYVFTLSVNGQTRATVDITAAVIQHLYHNGDGFYGYEVAMVVQSSNPFVAERPMYWNTANTQGGSDAIGYTGG